MGGSSASVGNQILGGLNTGTKFLTGYDPSSGQWSTHGSYYQMGDELAGEVDGRNAGRAAVHEAQNEANNAAQDAQNLLNNQRWSQMQSDVTASNTAGAARTAASAAASASPNFSTSTPLAFGSQYLGAASSNSDQKAALGT